ncbi:MAG: hypothetical protein ACE365_01870 [Gammaproteobacteria bacterium]
MKHVKQSITQVVEKLKSSRDHISPAERLNLFRGNSPRQTPSVFLKTMCLSSQTGRGFYRSL